MRWNEVVYRDCLDEERGLPSLPDDSVELCFADPPFNVGFRGKEGHRGAKPGYYPDSKEGYWEWCGEWFSEVRRVCRTVMVHFAKTKAGRFRDLEEPYDVIYWSPTNAQPSPGKASWLTLLHPVLCWGAFGKKRLNKDLYRMPMHILPGLTHPCPLNIDFVAQVLLEFGPESVLDPFLGSGTTAGACRALDIPWIGWEADERWSGDIERTLRIAPRELEVGRGQLKVDSFLG
jgi:site-specific DNA-methyltransferase (adenine-specific)